MRFLTTLVLGLLLLGWTVWRGSHAAPKPAWVTLRTEFTQPRLAFEFARQPAEIRDLFGVGSETTTVSSRMAYRHRLRHALRLDALFVFLYAAFLAVFSLELGQYVGLPFVAYGGAAGALFLGYCAGLVSEQLLGILAQLDTGRYAEPLGYLPLFTGLKWGTFPLLALTWLPALWRLGTLSRILFVVAGTVGVLGFAFWLPWDKPEILEVAAAGVGLLTGLLVPYAALLAWATNRSDSLHPTWL